MCVGDRQFRGKVTWFTFVFSLLVVWVHAYNAELYLGNTNRMVWVSGLEHLIGEGLGQFAVPGFFMISSYLFYRNFSWERLKSKWCARAKSILLPYLLWNGIYYLGYVLASRLPGITEIVGKGEIAFTLPAFAEALLFYTYNYVFWYLYQLILLILLAPLLYPILKRKWLGVGFQLILWLLLIWNVELPQLNLDALAYYSFAAYAALHARAWVEQGSGSRKQTAIGAMLLVLGGVCYWQGLRTAQPEFFAACRLIVVVGLWMVVSEERLPPVKDFMTHNFFLYATHFAFVRLINKAGTRVFPASETVPILLYLLMPGFVLVISSCLGAAVRRFSPVVWRILNGGRTGT